MNFSLDFSKQRDIWPRTESVGAIAIDRKGHIAVGASSGGWNGKQTGKFNEACSIGGGIYADDELGGVSLTGNDSLCWVGGANMLMDWVFDISYRLWQIHDKNDAGFPDNQRNGA